jgi:DNA-binding response OmpR family regulator
MEPELSAEDEDPIFVADPDRRHVTALRTVLHRAGYPTIEMRDDCPLVAQVVRQRPRLLMMSVALPYIDARDTSRVVRRLIGAPVILLGRRMSDGNAHAAIRLGANAYLGKPYTLPDLFGQIHHLLGRPLLRPPQDSLRVGAITIDHRDTTVSVNGSPIECTPTEFDLLTALASRPGAVLTRAELGAQCIATGGTDSTRIVDMHISNLRKKIEDDPRHPRYVRTVRGVGYMLARPAGPASRRPRKGGTGQVRADAEGRPTTPHRTS